MSRSTWLGRLKAILVAMLSFLAGVTAMAMLQDVPGTHAAFNNSGDAAGTISAWWDEEVAECNGSSGKLHVRLFERLSEKEKAERQSFLTLRVTNGHPEDLSRVSIGWPADASLDTAYPAEGWTSVHYAGNNTQVHRPDGVHVWGGSYQDFHMDVTKRGSPKMDVLVTMDAGPAAGSVLLECRFF